MKTGGILQFSLVLGSVTSATLLGVTAVHADNPSWAEQQVRNREMQRQALQQQAQQGYSPQVQQGQRWEQEWRQQHPGEPMPSFGALEKMHRGETMSNLNAGMSRMWQNRQAELRRNRLWARQNQENDLARQHITWTSQQWANWDREYDAEQRQRAQEYLEAVRQAAEHDKAEREEQERRKMYGYDH